MGWQGRLALSGQERTMDKRLNLFVPTFLTVCILSLPLMGDQPVVSAGNKSVVHPESSLHREYRGFSSRLAALDERIDENVDKRLYTSEEAAKHHADLKSIRARFRNITNKTRWLSAAQRAQIDSDIKAQELLIGGEGKP
jgi:hypothetical protein